MNKKNKTTGVLKLGAIFLACIFILLSTGCVAPPPMLTKQEAFAGMYEEKPKAILVVPAINQSTAADAANYYASTIAQPLTQSGYYVFPIPVTDMILNQAGIADGAQLVSVPAGRFGELFGADAVLFVTINIWDTNYYVLGGNVTVGLAFKLVSTTSSETLWKYKDTIVIDTSGSSNGGLLGALIETAINTAVQDYVPIAQQVNVRAISTFPYGQYHPEHGADGLLEVVNANKINDFTE